ncbi:hypothetical protein GCM10010269_26840 [Streptomyces humidus]|uniref:Uncharacterized protein n=1 Tax=Streptomyces humidus TaxID=52259 RepID=A0A918L351_9ACTN|nr:hypothetical protein GCM10010269_26840 [Streptomyces humidus]
MGGDAVVVAGRHGQGVARTDGLPGSAEGADFGPREPARGPERMQGVRRNGFSPYRRLRRTSRARGRSVLLPTEQDRRAERLFLICSWFDPDDFPGEPMTGPGKGTSRVKQASKL